MQTSSRNLGTADQLENLIKLDCNGTSTMYLPDLSMLTYMDSLHVSKTPNIQHIGSLPKNLENIYWEDCPNVGEQKISNAQVQQGDS
jgi:hypothetical protein